MDLLEGDFFSRCTLSGVSPSKGLTVVDQCGTSPETAKGDLLCNASPHRERAPPLVLPSTPEVPQFFVCYVQDT